MPSLIRFFPGFLAISSIFFAISPMATASTETHYERDVRLGLVEGDVRLSRGVKDHSDLGKTWEQALRGELVAQGFALATGDGRVSIDFENGATVFLAENSLLIFSDLDDSDDGMLSTLVLVSGSATFSLSPVPKEEFIIETPSDRLHVLSPNMFYARVDAYLDGRGVTPQGEKGEALFRQGASALHYIKGQTLALSHGAIVPPSQPANPAVSTDQNLQTSHPTISPDWDSWVSERVAHKAQLTNAALKSSGLSAPVPGLTELYRHGTFFQCAPYGTCWEPSASETDSQPDLLTQSSPSHSQLPSPSAPATPPSGVFQPQVVRWREASFVSCGVSPWVEVTRVAHTPQELQDLLRRKALAERQSPTPNHFLEDCYHHSYVFHRGHYAQVVQRERNVICHARRCKNPPHSPYPHLTPVKVGNRIGFVPRHPLDQKGKPPINLKNGVLFPSPKPGQPFERVTLDSSQKFKVLEKLPTESQRQFVYQAAALPQPEIRARLMRETPRDSSSPISRSDMRIAYDVHSQKILISGDAGNGHSVHNLSIASVGLGGNGFSGHAGGSLGAVSHSGFSGGSSAGNSGGRSSGSGSYSASSSGGGRSSGGGSSSSASSSGGSHYSGGGGGSSSSSSSSSASSSSASSSAGSSASGGRPH
ncbi:MAG TPA: FecR domain-containing protein [Candidatus Dormibacteraeota bacterium]|nr:FecR domain-containing protein [Candidatus Dormibacteraeota bacterium]